MSKKCIRGFTLIELTIVIVIISVFLSGLYYIGVYAHRQYIKLVKQADIKSEVNSLYLMIKGDIARGGKLELHPDNHGITVNLPGQKRSYCFKDEAIYLVDGKKERRLTRGPVADAVWIVDNGLVSMSVVSRYKNLNTGDMDCCKIIKDIELEK